MFRSVTLDGPLSDLLLNKGEYIELLSWEEVFSRCQAKMSPAYGVAVPGQRPVVKKGKLEPILLNVATRAANKKVRKCHGSCYKYLNISNCYLASSAC